MKPKAFLNMLRKEVDAERSQMTDFKSDLKSEAEFCDSEAAFKRFGIKRSLLYELHSLGLIKGASLQREGRSRGKRLWQIASIRSYINSMIDT